MTKLSNCQKHQNVLGNFRPNLMKKLQIFVITLLFISCNSKTEKNSETIKQINSLHKVAEIGTEKLYPIKKGTEIFDTLIVNKQIKISIKRKDLDSYVVHKSWSSDKMFIEKYRNAEIILTIKQNENIIIDTIFRKEQFTKSFGKEFLDIAIFHNYWFNKIDENGIEFLGVLTEPETDNSFDFNNYFNFKTKSLEFSIPKESEE